MMLLLLGGVTIASLLSPAPGIQPMFDLKGRACAAAPDLTTGQSLPYTGRETSFDGDIGPGAPCIQTAQGAVLYRVFQLPAGGTYVVTVTSEPSGGAILLPHLLLLGTSGEVKREIARDDLMYRGRALSARFRSHAEEAYLVVESDPRVVGTSVSRVAESTNSMVAPVGVSGYVTIHTGNDETMQLTYSHTGKVEIVLEPMPDPK
jgi:hypothetical protein